VFSSPVCTSLSLSLFLSLSLSLSLSLYEELSKRASGAFSSQPVTFLIFILFFSFLLQLYKELSKRGLGRKDFSGTNFTRFTGTKSTNTDAAEMVAAIYLLPDT